MGQVIMNGCAGGGSEQTRFIDEPGGCCTAALSVLTHARTHPGVGSYGSDVTGGVVLRR